MPDPRELFVGLAMAYLLIDVFFWEGGIVNPSVFTLMEEATSSAVLLVIGLL